MFKQPRADMTPPLCCAALVGARKRGICVGKYAENATDATGASEAANKHQTTREGLTCDTFGVQSNRVRTRYRIIRALTDSAERKIAALVKRSRRQLQATAIRMPLSMSTAKRETQLAVGVARRVPKHARMMG
jgi:hypothetical protein